MVEIKEIEKTVLISGTKELLGEEQIIGIVAGNVVMLPFGNLDAFVTEEEFVQKCWNQNASESFRENHLDIYRQLKTFLDKMDGGSY